MNKDQQLSQIDLDDLDFSQLTSHVVAVEAVDSRIVATLADGSSADLGSVTVPPSKTIENVEIQAGEDLVFIYTDGTEDRFNSTLKRTVPLTVVGSGLLTNRDNNTLEFSPPPIDASMSLAAGKLGPARSTMTYDNYARLYGYRQVPMAGGA